MTNPDYTKLLREVYNDSTKHDIILSQGDTKDVYFIVLSKPRLFTVLRGEFIHMKNGRYRAFLHDANPLTEVIFYHAAQKAGVDFTSEYIK